MSNYKKLNLADYLDQFDHNFKVGDHIIVNRKNYGNFSARFYEGILEITKINFRDK